MNIRDHERNGHQCLIELKSNLQKWRMRENHLTIVLK